MKLKSTLLTMAAYSATVLATTLGGVSIASAEDITLRIAVPDWPPTRIMKELADANYKAPSGNNVTLEPDFIPWPDYYTRLAASLTSGEKKYQMAVSDSQWLGAFIEGGYFRKINDFIDADPELQGIMKDLHPNLVAAYSTYPHKSDNYYGFPQMPDILISYYREDVFCHADEQAAFQAEFGYKLPCTPEEMNNTDWDMFEDYGKFFRRDKGEKLAGEVLENDFYGISYQAGKGYDFSSMQANGFIWQYGGDIWDETMAPKGKAKGVVNSDASKKGFEHYVRLTEYMPPVVKTGTMDIFKTDELFREGNTAVNINWIGFAETAISPDTSKVADKINFAMMPGLKKDGKMVRWSNIGGQPFVMTTWNDETTNKEIVDFVKWWLSKETQTEFAKRGGQSGLQSVINDPSYATFRPWNHTVAEGLEWQKDVWHIPEFFELLVQQQEEFDKAITGQKSPSEALDAVAEFQEELLMESGHIQ